MKPYPFYQSSNPLLADHTHDLEIFKDRPFWCGNNIANDNPSCCFNHIIGLPVKNGKEHPIYDYELDVINKIENNRNIWIKKARGIGLTELTLRYLAWKIVSSNELEYKKILIISGTFQQHAHDVIQRLENLFRLRFPLMKLESRFTDLWIRNTNIKTFPSRNCKDLRGFTDVVYIFVDESDYFDLSQQDELKAALTAYEEKSHCTTIMCSTPNRPGGLFEQIELDKDSKYYKIILDYTVGLDKIYDRAEIQKKMNEPEFQREYCGLYLGKVGNLLSQSQIQNIINLGSEYDTDKIPVSLYTLKSVGIDPSFGSSSTGIVTLEHIKVDNRHIIRVVDVHLIEHGDPNELVNICWDVYKQNNYMNTAYFIDGSNRAAVNLMKVRWQESLSWETKTDFGHNSNIKIRPVIFSTEHKNMLANLHAVVTKGYLAIPERYDKLITSLRTAWAEELNLKKDQTSYSDLFDALRLSLKAYNIE
jgi:hypothetical protein